MDLPVTTRVASYIDKMGFASSEPVPASDAPARNSWGLFEHPAWTAAKNLLGGNSTAKPAAPEGAGKYLNVQTILFGLVGAALILFGVYMAVVKGKSLTTGRLA